MRLGLYIDGAFRRDPGDGRVHCGTELFGFMRFAGAVGARMERFVLIARGTPDVESTPLALPAGVELMALPYYPSLRALGRVMVAIPATIGCMWRSLDHLDAVWVSGVHPLGLMLVAIAMLRRRQVVLLIRQDSPAYFRTRLPSRAWAPLLAPLRALDWAFRTLARRRPTTVVGADIARRYRAPRPNVLEMHVTLLERDQLVASPRDPDWGERVELLTVGRIDPEKNPLLVADALAELDGPRPGRFRLTWVGEGSLAAALRQRVEELGIADSLRLAGFVPFGPELLATYRDSDAFVHVALTEGVPGVLYEAMGSGLPIVATEIGGVREALAGGERGLLVAPGDAAALAAAVRRLDQDRGLRARLSAAGLERAGEVTLESESARVAEFITGSTEARG